MKKILLLPVSLLAFVVVMMGGVQDAAAHSFPEEENPAAGQTVAAAPSEVKIKFDAPIEKLFATVAVLDADGQNLADGAPEVSSDGIELTVKLRALKPGGYTVKWGVVCVDTHHTEGSYSFTVAGGGA
jgi:methionine-rich copper-binding protein CopC